MTPGTGSPYLGPHVVGQRVVVRRVVAGETGPTGGPAFTDVLGVCLAWDPCVVETAAGSRVVIPLADIVSGKPVPPRPSVRLRAGVAECEARTAGLWERVEVEQLHGWTLRSSALPHRRANSCLAVTPPPVAASDAARAVREWYAARGRPSLLHVEADSAIEEELLRHGWDVMPSGEAEFLIAAVSRLGRALRGGGPEAELVAGGDRATATVADAGATVARGEARLDGDWLGIHGMWVEPAHRRAGLARAALAALVEWGAEQGARTAWLHVETDNTAALALYREMGFDVHHTMRYLVPAADL